jgi:hypothetical protein
VRISQRDLAYTENLRDLKGKKRFKNTIKNRILQNIFIYEGNREVWEREWI